MTNPKHIQIGDYAYSLPEERIARYPVNERDQAKLLVYKKGNITTDIYRNITRHLPENSLLIFNDTRVIEARLLFQKPTGGTIEIFCLEPHEQYADITTAMLQKKRVWWLCLVGGASKWKKGQLLQKKIRQGESEIVLTAHYIEKRTDSFLIELSWTPSSLSFAELLHHSGAIPLPPYLKRAVEESDTRRYQTVYARFDGSVAAPTAGLHFTEHIFRQFRESNIQTDFLTLHVGAGTFKPVKSKTMQDHEMHAEWIDVPKATLENILENLQKNIIAVGTTSLRTIESLYWLGRKLILSSGNNKPEPGPDIGVSQWDAYDHPEKDVPVRDALESLLELMNKNKLGRLLTQTRLLIVPGYHFKIVKGLITNFHQPRSTLLLLVAALVGEDLPTGQAGWKKVYDYALQEDFRFLSYGDGCLLWETRPGQDD